MPTGLQLSSENGSHDQKGKAGERQKTGKGGSQLSQAVLAEAPMVIAKKPSLQTPVLTGHWTMPSPLSHMS